MRTMLMIAFTMFSLAGCVAEGDEASAQARRFPEEVEVEEEDDEKPPFDRVEDELDEEPTEIAGTQCSTNQDCWLNNPDTAYRMCDLVTSTCIESPYPF